MPCLNRAPFVLAIFALGMLAFANAATAQLISGNTKNGNFSTATGSDFGSWTESGTVAVGNNGSQYAELGSGDSISQAFNLTGLYNLTLTFLLIDAGSGTATVNVVLAGIADSFSRGGGGSANQTFPATSLSNVQLNGDFSLSFSRTGGTVGIDNVILTATAVPTPLAGGGIVSLAF